MSSNMRKEIMDCLKSNEPLSAIEISRKIGRSEKATHRILAKMLQDERLITKETEFQVKAMVGKSGCVCIKRVKVRKYRKNETQTDALSDILSIGLWC